MSLIHIVVLLGTGVVVGFAGGMLGLGGAFIMTPVQHIVYTSMGLPPDLAVKMAFGTNLMVILPTAIAGTWVHQHRREVWWRAAIIIGGCTMIAGFAGAAITAHLPGLVLEKVFGGVVILGGGRMLFSRTLRIDEAPRDNPWLWVACGLPIGLITGILGIGGGLVAIPVMTLVLRFRLHTAAATSLAMMIFASTGGLIGYIFFGRDVAGLPPYSLGYVNLQAWLFLAVTSISMVQVGAVLAHRVPDRQLRYAFVAIMLLLGLKMLGASDWLGLPV